MLRSSSWRICALRSLSPCERLFSVAAVDVRHWLLMKLPSRRVDADAGENDDDVIAASAAGCCC